MARFVREAAKFGIIQISILAFCLYCFFNFPKENDPSAWGSEKIARLEQAESPRLIIMGDSNVVLGLNSEPFAKAFPEYHPVNAGLYAFLGNGLLLSEIEDEIKPGDVVLLSWVYAHFAANEIQYLFYRYAVHRPEAFLNFSKEEIYWFLEGGLFMIREAARETWNVLFEEREAFVSPYGPENLNKYGDGVGHYGLESPPGSRFEMKAFDAKPNGYTSKVIDRLNAFNRRVEAKGGKVFFAYAPLTQKSYDDNLAELDELDELLHQRLDFPVLNHPSEMIFEHADMFDSGGHLKEAAVFERSDELVEDLEPYLDDAKN